MGSRKGTGIGAIYTPDDPRLSNRTPTSPWTVGAIRAAIATSAGLGLSALACGLALDRGFGLALCAYYALSVLDQMMSVVTASTVVVYGLYAISPDVERKLGTP